MKKNRFLFFLLLIVSHLNAQKVVPGYMGKRIFIGYSLKLSPVIQGPTLKKSSNEYLVDDEPISKSLKLLGLNHTHSISLDYVFNFRKVVCLNFQYLRTGVDYQNRGYYYVVPKDNSPAEMNSLGIALGVKLFKRSYFAPLGAYVKWEAVFFMNQLKFEKDRFLFHNYNNNSETIFGKGEQMLSFQTAGLAFSFGKQRMIADKILIDRGIRFLFLPEGFFMFGESDSNPGSPSSFMESGGLVRLFRHQLINLNIGFFF